MLRNGLKEAFERKADESRLSRITEILADSRSERSLRRPSGLVQCRGRRRHSAGCKPPPRQTLENFWRGARTCVSMRRRGRIRWPSVTACIVGWPTAAWNTADHGRLTAGSAGAVAAIEPDDANFKLRPYGAWNMASMKRGLTQRARGHTARRGRAPYLFRAHSSIIRATSGSGRISLYDNAGYVRYAVHPPSYARVNMVGMQFHPEKS